MTSKSVNDISLAALKPQNSNVKLEDFVSDPNLLSNDDLKSTQKLPQSKSEKIKERRQKDPDRRKSLIQAVSNFFTKNKKEKSSTDMSTTSSSTTPTSSPPKNKDSQDQTQPKSQMVTSASHDGVASRFRATSATNPLSGNMKPSKEKSKVCFSSQYLFSESFHC